MHAIKTHGIYNFVFEKLVTYKLFNYQYNQLLIKILNVHVYHQRS